MRIIIVLSMHTDYIEMADNVPHSEYKEKENPYIYKSKNLDEAL